MTSRLWTYMLLALSFAAVLCDAPAKAAQSVRRAPNIILILADDVGFSDLGCYGSEIQTPNLDRLAAGGLRFTQFYNSARCCPSRASLLTGQYPHAVSFGGMSGSLPDTCLTIPEVLRTAGYRTYMAGKWHLGNPGPIKRGFDEYFGMLGGFGSFWNPKLYTRLPQGRPSRDYAEGTFYSTDVFTDYALDFIADARKGDKPYFMYLAYNAAHFPLHAPKADIARYADKYTQGWDAIRDKRYARLKELGIISGNWPLPPRSTIPPNKVATEHGWNDKQNPAWESIDAARRADLARRMAIYAAMIDHMDNQLGRIISDLEKNRELDNTLIFFLSDNGACAEWDPWGFDIDTGPKNVLHNGAELDDMGQVGTYHSYGSGWANACNTPFRFYKHYSHEGGIATPLIVHWPAGFSRKNEIDHRPGHVIDLMATCAEVAGAAYPKQIGGREIMPREGRSLVPALRKQPDPSRTLFFEHEGSRSVRQGDLKLVALSGQPWELYDMQADRVELNDLAAQRPEKVKELSELWDEWARRVHARP